MCEASQLIIRRASRLDYVIAQIGVEETWLTAWSVNPRTRESFSVEAIECIKDLESETDMLVP